LESRSDSFSYRTHLPFESKVATLPFWAGTNRKRNMTENYKETLGVFNPEILIDELWQTAVEAASPAEFGPRCGRFLRAWNTLAVERMETEGRLTPGNLATAESNLRRFIQLMKSEAVFLCHADRLDRDCFHAAHRRLERRSILTQFTLWPFWPNSVAVKEGNQAVITAQLVCERVVSQGFVVTG
jgi:hypothetical protein